jgi:hypothetical protein
VICKTCRVQFRRFGADGEIHRTHCYRHHDADTQAPDPDPLAILRLRRAYTSSESAPDPEPTTATDRLLAVLSLPALEEAA